MKKPTAITIRVDQKLKADAQSIFVKLGFTTTQAISLFLQKVSLHKCLPFAVEIPNEKTAQAIDDAINNHNLKTFENADATLASLDV